MVKYDFDRDKIRSLSTILMEKNNLSTLNRYTSNDLSQEDISCLSEMGIIDVNGDLISTLRPTMEVMSNPHAVVKVNFTGGVGVYEHNVSYDKSFKNRISFTVTPDNFSIEDEADPFSIVKTLEDFVGKSSLKSVHVSIKVDVKEAFVIAAMLDMERKSTLRAFVDEIPFSHNAYNATMIWRIINSTTSSIQWFVSIINNIVGEHGNLSQQLVQDAIDQLIIKGVIKQTGVQYQLSNDLSILSNRMIIVDNILSVQASKQDESNEIISTGFTCVQSGVHDLLFLDYNGKEMMFETITSVKLMDYLNRFLNCEAYFTNF